MATSIFAKTRAPISFYTVHKQANRGFAAMIVTKAPGIRDLRTTLATAPTEDEVIAIAQDAARRTGKPYYPRGKRP